MSTNLNTRFVNPLPLNSQETVLLQIEEDKPTVFTPKLLKWDEITLPDELELQEPQPSAKIERRDIDQIIEESDGRVILKFRSLSIKENISNPRPSNNRRSFSDFSSTLEPLDHSQRYRFGNPIPEPIIDPPSPTSSWIGTAINVLTNIHFSIDWTNLKTDYYSPYNATLHAWFEQIDKDLRDVSRKNGLRIWNALRSLFLSFCGSLPLLLSKACRMSTPSIALMFKQIYSKPGIVRMAVLFLLSILQKMISKSPSKVISFWLHLFAKAGRETRQLN